MRKKVVMAAVTVLVAVSLLGCSPRASMATLSADADSATAEAFSLTKVLDLGTNYLVTLDYENAILQYIDVIQHDPKNKEAYAGLYVAYAAQGETEKANEIFQKAQEVFEDDAEFLPEILKDSSLVLQHDGGSAPYQVLTDHYWGDLNSPFAKEVSEAWIKEDPKNAEPYALLGAHCAALDDTTGLTEMLQNAEENGIDLQTINSTVEVNSDGTCTLTLEIEDFMQAEEDASGAADKAKDETNKVPAKKDENGKTTIKVEVNEKDTAKTVTQKVAEKAADSAASKVVEESGLTGEAASIAASMAQEALRKGLGASGTVPSGSGGGNTSSKAASTQAPAQDDGADEAFDWSEIEAQFPAFSDDFPS